MIDVAVVEDHPLYRQGLVQAIESATGVRLVGAYPSLEEFDRELPDAAVVLLDLNLPGRSGADGVDSVCQRGFRVLVVSASDSQSAVLDAIAAGATGYLTKDAEGSEIVAAIETVASGGSYVSPTLASYLLKTARGDRPTAHHLTLSQRELEILALVAQGDTDQDIADRLFISVRTVRSHLDRIRDKTGRRRRPDLTRLAMEEGIVGPEPGG